MQYNSIAIHFDNLKQNPPIQLDIVAYFELSQRTDNFLSSKSFVEIKFESNSDLFGPGDDCCLQDYNDTVVDNC